MMGARSQAQRTLRRSNETFSDGCLVNTPPWPPRRDYAGIDKTFAHIVLYQIKYTAFNTLTARSMMGY